ncbi:hypothetical protein JCM33374_g4490 [Metschnikowia sp. JCM 33374]|nr:hypothetical protein JCM33374_g4490 [Metschnikowia sp. JCM 33374]
MYEDVEWFMEYAFQRWGFSKRAGEIFPSSSTYGSLSKEKIMEIIEGNNLVSTLISQQITESEKKPDLFDNIRHMKTGYSKYIDIKTEDFMYHIHMSNMNFSLSLIFLTALVAYCFGSAIKLSKLRSQENAVPWTQSKLVNSSKKGITSS